MAFKVGDQLGDHAIVEDLLDDPKHPRENFGYRQFDPEIGSTLGDYTVVAEGTKDAKAVWVHIDGSPEGTSNKVWLVKS